MRGNWYPEDREELKNFISKTISVKTKKISGEIHGLIVPHAGYQFSGAVAGKAYSLLKEKNISKTVIFGPSHYVGFNGIKTLEKIETPFGKVKIPENNFGKLNYEHSVENQIPFLQVLNPNIEILPLVIGEITSSDALKFAEKIFDEKVLFVFSTDLSHFLDYKTASAKDKNSIKIIEKVELEKFNEIDACGIYSLLILFHICKFNNWKPRLIEYKNSGDVTRNKSSVVGYASFLF